MRLTTLLTSHRLTSACLEDTGAPDSGVHSVTSNAGRAFGVDGQTETRLREQVLPGLAGLLESLPEQPPTSADPDVYRVAHGFYCRTGRTCQAALLLMEAGRASEAAPLRRAAFEHAVSLAWVLKEGPAAVAALTRAHQGRMRSIRNLLDDSWTVGDADFEALLALEVPSGGQDHLVRITEVIKQYGLPKSLLVAWLADTGESHPSYLTARAYWHSSGTRLLTYPGDRSRSDVFALAFIWWLASCEMGSVANWGQPLAELSELIGLPVMRLLDP